MAKRYLDPDLNLVVRVGRAARENVAFIGRLLSQNCVQFGGQGGVTNDTEAVRRRIGLYQPPMLTCNVQVMEGPQKQRYVSSVVWLETFYHHLISGGKSSYLFTPSALKLGNSETDRKINIFFSYMAVSLGQPVSKQIETAPQGIDDGAGFGVHDAGNGFKLSDLPNLFAGLRIFLCRDDVWTAVDPARNPFTEDIELGYGPIYAGLGVEEIVAHGYWSGRVNEQKDFGGPDPERPGIID